LSKGGLVFSQEENPVTLQSNNSVKMVTDPLEESKHREETQAAESELSDNAHAYFTDNALGDQIGGNFADERI
jgi:hypothetical protein